MGKVESKPARAMSPPINSDPSREREGAGQHEPIVWSALSQLGVTDEVLEVPPP